jgi:hypothetical protein
MTLVKQDGCNSVRIDNMIRAVVPKANVRILSIEPLFLT